MYVNRWLKSITKVLSTLLNENLASTVDQSLPYPHIEELLVNGIPFVPM